MESTTNTAKQHCVTLALEVPPTINSPQNKDAKSPEAARFIQSSQQKPPAFIPLSGIISKIPRSRIRGNPENRIPDACHPQAEAGSGPEKNPQGKQHKKQHLELCGLGQVSDPLTPPFPRVQQSCCEEIAGLMQCKHYCYNLRWRKTVSRPCATAKHSSRAGAFGPSAPGLSGKGLGRRSWCAASR